MTGAPTLYHFTCHHSLVGIRHSHRLQPWRQPMLRNTELAWATDMAEPDPLALGLTSDTLACDRTAFRLLIVYPEQFEPWAAWLARNMRALHLAPDAVSMLTSPPRQPQRWWVSEATRISVRYDS